MAITASAIQPRPVDEAEALRKAARGLEAAVIRQWMEAMEKAQLESGVFGSGPGAGVRTSTYRLLLSEALGEAEPLGLAERIVEDLSSRGQEETRREITNKYLAFLEESSSFGLDDLPPQVGPLPTDE